jgi:aryl-alcohol dehydrogenase-like predicted oxidoreductase
MNNNKGEFEMLPTKEFGRTGHTSTRIIFGAAALGGVTQDVADQTLEVLLQYGVNHIDTASSYGESELRIGPWMAQHRKDFFLATKMKERNYKKAKEEFQTSLERLKVDHVDLLQLHALTDPIEWQTAFGPGGVLEWAIEARQQGLTRFIGVTGHGLSIAAMHQRSLANFDFDSVLLPYNFITYQTPKYQEDFDTLVTMCKEKNVAVQTIKGIARRPWGLTQTHTSTTWYEPLVEQEDITKAVHWVLGNPDVFLNTAGDVNLLPKVLEAATHFEATPSDAEMEALLSSQEFAPLFV